MSGDMNLTRNVWRQSGPNAKGKFESYKVEANEHMSFLEMLDVLNEQLLAEKKRPITFEHDCREGICGSCSMVIDGRPHGPQTGTTACQLHMRHYKDCLLYTSPSPRDQRGSRMPSSA